MILRNSTILSFSILVGLSLQALAQPKQILSLERYLEQVRTQNPKAIAQAQLVKAYEQRLDKGKAQITPTVYTSYHLLDDRKPNQNVQFMGDRTNASSWKLGIRDQTTFGLSADLYLDSTSTRVWGASSTFLPTNPYRDTRAVLELKQSLWRNSFGDGTRAEVQEARAGSEAQLAQAQFEMQTLLTEAENNYWSLVSYNEVVRLQLANVERARKLRDYMKQRAKMRLYDDVDYLQTQASFESRELEYQTSLDERQTVLRNFNTLRGANSDQLEELESLPTSDWRKDLRAFNEKNVSRKDFVALKARAASQRAGAIASRSKIRPELDLVGAITTTGRSQEFQSSLDRAQDFNNPTYSIGVNFSVAIDFEMIHTLRDSYRAEQHAAEALERQADFYQTREWQDALQKKKDAIGRFDRALSLESLYSNIVKKERQRLLNGRTTTFQLLNFEQEFANVQVQRVKSQLALLQLHNSLKLFTEKNAEKNPEQK